MNSLNKLQRYLLTMVSTAVVLAFVFGIAMVGSAAYAQEIPAASVSRDAHTFGTLFASRVTTATGAATYGSAFDVTPYDQAEMQIVVDQGALVAGAPNTVTIALESSNDRINWTSGAILSAVAVDTNTWLTPTITGRYNRVKVTPSSDGTIVTTTVSAVLEP